MRAMLLIRPVLFVTCALALSTGAANAGLYGSGTLTTTSLGNDEYFVTGITGTLNGAPVSLLSTADPIANPDPSQCPTEPQDYAAAGYVFDDIIYFPGFPGANTVCQSSALSLDTAGLGLEAGGITYNLIGANGDNYTATGYYYFLATGPANPMTFAVSSTAAATTFTFSVGSVPEPAPLALLIAGLAGIAFLRWRRKAG